MGIYFRKTSAKTLNRSNQLYISETFLKSDILGAWASGLCAIHCLSTPFIFVVQSCAVNKCCEASPLWWSSIDYIFIAITFFAVYQSSKNSSKNWMKYGFYGTWIILSFLVINEKVGFIAMSPWWKYLAAMAMITLHLYNLKYCQCKGKSCCIHETI